jgi:hypothetical protein
VRRRVVEMNAVFSRLFNPVAHLLC